MKGHALVAAICALVAALPVTAQAATETFTTAQSQFDPGVNNQGWWSTSTPNLDSNANYIAGSFGGDSYRNFFTFDLLSACRASTVTLRLTRLNASSTDLVYSLFDVTTPAPTLNANDGTNLTIFSDLGSGTTFGSFSVAAGAPNDVLSFPLNTAGVAAFNAARGGFLSLGGAVTPPGSFLFGEFRHIGGGPQQLVVTCAESVPATAKEDCKNGGWQNYPQLGFNNQGDCVSYVATNGKNPPGRKGNSAVVRASGTA